MSICSEYSKAPQNDARSKERRYYAKKSSGLKDIDGVLNVEGDEIWISAYWLIREGLSTGLDDGSHRGRPTKARLLARQTISM
jgi:hypothetical protein